MRGARRRRIAALPAPALLLALLLGLLGAACGDTGGSGGSPSAGAPATAGPRPSSVATLEIVRPRNGQVVMADAVRLRVSLDGGELVDRTSTDLQPDQGHLHVVVDDRLISMTSGLEQLIPDLAPGTHLVKVEFVANDHAPFDPRVIAAATFEVKV